MSKGVFLHKKFTDIQKLNHKISLCKYRNKPTDDVARFWSYVDIKDLFDCWEWKGTLTKSGYGNFTINSKLMRSHRLSYELYYGKITNCLQINHKCHNKKCCNPFHLYAGTHQDNMTDMVNAERQAKGESQGNAKLTERQIIEIRENKDKLSQGKLGRIYGVSQGTVSEIMRNEIWRHI